MTKENLNEIIDLKREVDLLKQKLHDLNYGDSETIVTDKVKGSMSIFPYSARSFTLMGLEQMSAECIRERDNIGKTINDKCHKLFIRINEAFDYIESIDDSELRTILTYRYIDGLNTKDIGECIGWSSRTIERRLKEWAESCR